MKKNEKILSYALISMLAFCQFSAAQAGYLGENLQTKQAADAENATKPIMIIRFNQQYVYFQEPLKKVVQEVGYAQKNAIYEVQSVVPTALSKEKDSSLAKESDLHLHSVLTELGKLGVSSDRLNTNVIYSDDVKSQEIRIFVK